MSEILKMEGVRKSFDKREVLRGIDLRVTEGEVVALLGASGSGKSALLRRVNFLEARARGASFCADRKSAARSAEESSAPSGNCAGCARAGDGAGYYAFR